MHAHIFQHVPFEGPGSIGARLSSLNAKLTTTRFYADEIPPDIDDLDLLIVLGGPMSVNDTGTYPWLALEKAFIHAAVHAGKPVLGICLGAQLIASAMGAEVYANPVKEIGWFPVFGTSLSTGFRLPEKLTVLHWHGETFDLPPGADLLASSPACENQAFQLRDRKVIGLQFHLETTPDTLAGLIENCRNELADEPGIMRETEMMSSAGDFRTACNRQIDQLLDYLTG